MAEVKSQLEAQGIGIIGESPAQFGQLAAREHAQWAEIVKAADIKAE
jgi:tripartite-type tricarboxylate transporter receptor subunit TctC